MSADAIAIPVIKQCWQYAKDAHELTPDGMRDKYHIRTIGPLLLDRGIEGEYHIRDGGTLIIAMPGSRSKGQWLANAIDWLRSFSRDGPTADGLHRTIDVSAGKVTDSIIEAVANTNTTSIIITCISRGAAVGGLAAIKLSYAIDLPILCVRFASPRFATKAFWQHNKFLSTLSMAHVVNGPDIVPHIPSRAAGWEHPPEEQRISAGRPISSRDKWRAFKLWILWRLGRGKKISLPWFNAHKIESYNKAISEL